MQFEYISVQTDNSENAAAFCDIFTDSLITAVVKSSLRKNDSHTSAGFQEVQVTLDKENISANLILPFSGRVFAQLITRNNRVFFDVSGKWGIRHD